ncbi:hypothetical protein IG631_17620 [Alternaria alternata]|nr:hypothetical protein IG631_17620 [Alternaria alternata]
MSSGGVPSVMDSRNTIEIEDPDFMFADDGEIIQFSPRRSLDRTTARTPDATMSSDARTSAWAPKEHTKGHRAGNQPLVLRSGLAALTWAQDTATHNLTAATRAHSGA